MHETLGSVPSIQTKKEAYEEREEKRGRGKRMWLRELGGWLSEWTACCTGMRTWTYILSIHLFKSHRDSTHLQCQHCEKQTERWSCCLVWLANQWVPDSVEKNKEERDRGKYPTSNSVLHSHTCTCTQTHTHTHTTQLPIWCTISNRALKTPKSLCILLRP